MIKLPGAHNGNNRVLVGYDLGKDFARISFAYPEGEVSTLSTVAGAENYSIPVLLCKREGVNQWFFGREAARYARENGGILVEHLLEKALDGEPVRIDGVSYQPASLLSLFIKRTLGLLQQSQGIDDFAGILFTVETEDRNYQSVMTQVVAGLHLKTEQIFYQSYTEDFYHYMIRQPGDLWFQGSLLLDYSGDKIRACGMEVNLRTRPMVMYIGEAMYDFPMVGQTGEDGRTITYDDLDHAFLKMAKEIAAMGNVSSIFLVGEQFSEEWMKESLRFLCGKYRVFRGNNLYSKGACFGLQDRIEDRRECKETIFLGNDKLTANVGMRLYRQGEEVYMALLDAGSSWFEATKSFDFYLSDGDYIDLEISSLVGGNRRTARITMEDFPAGMTRVHANLYLTDEKHLQVELEDLGMGNFRPATHHVWSEVIEL